MSNTPQLRRRRARLFHEQGGLCHYCLAPTQLETPPPNASAATLEHIIPRRLRMHMQDSPQVMACHGCNVGWASMVDQWLVKTFA